MKITYSLANSVDFGAPKRTVQFYKSTRPQAPARHYQAPDLAPLVECSVCRGLFFPDDRAVKAAHRAWHEAHKIDERYYPMPCGEARQAYGARYQFTPECPDCGEDLCPCATCQAQHTGECDRWAQVAALVEDGDGEAADHLADEIVAARTT